MRQRFHALLRGLKSSSLGRLVRHQHSPISNLRAFVLSHTPTSRINVRINKPPRYPSTHPTVVAGTPPRLPASHFARHLTAPAIRVLSLVLVYLVLGRVHHVPRTTSQIHNRAANTQLGRGIERQSSVVAVVVGTQRRCWYHHTESVSPPVSLRRTTDRHGRPAGWSGCPL